MNFGVHRVPRQRLLLRIGVAVLVALVVSTVAWNLASGNRQAVRLKPSVGEAVASADRYSTAECYGADPRRRMCRLENVCVDRDTGGIEFYVPQGRKDSWFVGSTGFGSLPKELVYLSKYSKRQEWSPQVVETERPAAGEDVFDDPAGLGVFFGMFYAKNIGHAFVDDILAAFRLLDFFAHAVKGREPRLVLRSACESWGREPDWLVTCHRRYEEMGATVSRLPVVFRNKMSERLRCFDTLLLGTGGLNTTPWLEDTYLHPLDPRPFMSPVLARFRAAALKRLGEDDEAPPAAPRLVLLDKRPGRRLIRNLPALADAARAHLPWSVDVQLVSSFANGTFADEVRFYRSVAAVVLSAGGSSLTAAFVHPAACVLLYDGFDRAHNGSAYMESFFWADLPGIYVQHLPVRRANCVEPANIARDKRAGLNADCDIDPADLLPLLDECRRHRKHYLLNRGLPADER